MNKNIIQYRSVNSMLFGREFCDKQMYENVILVTYMKDISI